MNADTKAARCRRARRARRRRRAGRVTAGREGGGGKGGESSSQEFTFRECFIESKQRPACGLGREGAMVIS